MSTPQQPQPDQRALRLHRLSLLFARFALIGAIPLCTALAMLLGIIYYPSNCNGDCPPPLRAILTLPIIGLPALLLQQGPFALMGLALLSLLLAITRRWQTRQRRKKADVPLLAGGPLRGSAAPAAAAPFSAPARKPKLWGHPLSLAVISLVLVALMLCALVPLSSTAFNDIGEMDLTSVSMVSANEGWAVGDFDQLSSIGNVRGVIWHYHNGQWTPMLSPAQSGLTGVSALPDGEAWAVGYDGTLLHELGGIWTQEASGTTDDLYGIAMISPTEGWVVGGIVPIASVNNRFVAGISAPAAHSRFSPAVTSRARDESNCTILHYTAGHWSSVTCPGRDPAIYPLESVAGLPDGEAWAVGYEGIFHERQGVWEQVKSPTRLGLRSIALVSATEGWAVGNSGIILHEQGGVWSQALQADAPYLNGVAVSSTGEGWMVGGSGSMLHETRGTWSPDAIPAITSNDYLDAVTLLPDGQEGWAVGVDQLILHLHNGVWSLYSRQASSKLPQ
ncbi:MAG TPA: hypothetical protein VKT82_12715 [Ktedonobacterales bacterium]|nr:hypothetical protein [Ktedonobacterales bacterium]